MTDGMMNLSIKKAVPTGLSFSVLTIHARCRRWRKYCGIG